MLEGVWALLTMGTLTSLLAVTSVSGSEVVSRQRRLTKPEFSNKFVGVSSRCSRGSLTVEVGTAEAFFGSVYARGYPGRCRVTGEGETTTILEVPTQKCGVKIIEDENGGHTYELLVYIQFDKWVQQVIDEQVHVRCRADKPEGELQAKAQMNVANSDPGLFEEIQAKSSEPASVKKNSIASLIFANDLTPSTSSSTSSVSSSSSSISSSISSSSSRSSSASNILRGNGRSSSSGSSSNTANKLKRLITSRNNSPILRSRSEEDTRDWFPVAAPPEVMRWKSKRPDGSPEPVSCWMDIVMGNNMDGKPVLDHLLVGDDATMVLKIRQESGLDTRITSCLAHDGSGEQSQDLIDENGCAVDDAIMPPLRVKSNVRSGVKVAYASFKAFKFPDRDNLHLKCTVLVCLGACQLPVCGRTSNRVGRRMGASGQGSIQPVDDLDSAVLVQQTSRGNDRALGGRVLDKVEVFNSVEVRAPGIESQQDLVKQYRTDRGPVNDVDFFSNESMFCVTPYKMILAFGVLLTVLLVALLFALYSCVKARVMKSRLRPPQPLEAQRRSPVTSPYYRFPH
ncbi:uncharacterized protein [Macrobrachium rosenbergii]|uniref:uncharacterized protein n=1 Tax=Macrobrachium rosenbergii TaxID=79674 RepID=UPI0034D5E96B